MMTTVKRKTKSTKMPEEEVPQKSDSDILRDRFQNQNPELNRSLKFFAKSCYWEEDQKRQNSVDEFMRTLSLFEQEVNKSSLVLSAHLRQIQQYKQLEQEIGTETIAAQAEIVKLKETLAQEQEIAKQKQEYIAMSKIINKYPSRQETLKNVASLEEELSAAKEEHAAVKTELELKQRQFALFFHSLSQLQALFKEEKGAEDSFDMGSQANPESPTHLWPMPTAPPKCLRSASPATDVSVKPPVPILKAAKLLAANRVICPTGTGESCLVTRIYIKIPADVVRRKLLEGGTLCTISLHPSISNCESTGVKTLVRGFRRLLASLIKVS
eukprot:g57417.t1